MKIKGVILAVAQYVPALLLGALIAFSGGGCAYAHADDSSLGSVAAVVEQVNDSVVMIHTASKDGNSLGAGSGVVYNAEQGVIVTNHHVVDGAKEMIVIFSDGSRQKAKLLSSDKYLDLALIQIQWPGTTKLRAAHFASAAGLRVGQQVLAIGNPYDLGQTATRGIICGLLRGPKHFIQSDAAINPGNSGGALFNMRGELVGINSEIYGKNPDNGFSGISLSIPIDIVAFGADELWKYGKVRRIEVGFDVDVKPYSPHMAVDPSPIVVEKVIPGMVGDRLGLKAGDVLVLINGRRVGDPYNLAAELMLQSVDKPLTMDVIRDMKAVRLTTVPWKAKT